MDRRNNQDFILLGDILDKVHHLETRSRIQAAGRLVEEQDFGARNELTGYAHTPLLAA